MSRNTALLSLLPVLSLLSFGCFESGVDNPTGTCEAEDDGSRWCYHAPAPEETYLPHCDAPLERELWRVFAMDEATAYMIPRPDGQGLELGICDGDDAGLAELFESNGLCEENADPDVINAMDPTEAMAISLAMHERLVFSGGDYGDGSGAVAPWAPDDDRVAACVGPLADDGTVAAYCEDLILRAANGECLDVGTVLSLEEAEVMAGGLNEIYGIVE